MVFSLDLISLKNWFLSEKRDLPWRHNREPYAVWISEVMLQQTQVTAVIPFYLSWMERFPTIHHLAKASLDEVIKAWEGLGYYSRARNLHEAAKYLVKNFDGQLPADETNLNKIKGFGPYTVGAILSFAFHQKKEAVDGNVIRVLTRYFGIQDDVSKLMTINKLRGMAYDLLPEEEHWVINEALIELGALVCQRKTRCPICPLKASCKSLQHGIIEQIPYKSKKTKVEHLHRSVAVIQAGSSYLVQRGKKGAIMSDLYEFPYFDIGNEKFNPKTLKQNIGQSYSLKVIQKAVFEEVRHSFTRYHAHLYPVLYQCLDPRPVEGLEWIPHESLKKVAFSSGHRRIFHQLSS